MKILVINGPNINMIGIREPEIYGADDYNSLVRYITQAATDFGIEIDCFQSNHEGTIIDKIQEAYGNTDGIVINPAGYTHTSIAIADALKAVSIPAVEVHLSDVDKREQYRRISFVKEVCIATIKGYGFKGYRMAMELLISRHSGH